MRHGCHLAATESGIFLLVCRTVGRDSVGGVEICWACQTLRDPSSCCEPMRVDEARTAPESDPQAPARANEVTPPTATMAHALANEALPWPPSDFDSAHPIAKYCSDFSPEHYFLLQLLGHRDSAQDVMLRRQSLQIE